MALFLNEAEAVRYRPYTNGDTPWYKQELKEPEDEFPVNYPVIDRGMDQDAISTLDVIGKTEKKLFFWFLLAPLSCDFLQNRNIKKSLDVWIYSVR